MEAVSVSQHGTVGGMAVSEWPRRAQAILWWQGYAGIPVHRSAGRLCACMMSAAGGTSEAGLIDNSLTMRSSGPPRGESKIVRTSTFKRQRARAGEEQFWLENPTGDAGAACHGSGRWPSGSYT